jgi:hypothetical protein
MLVEDVYESRYSEMAMAPEFMSTRIEEIT